MIASAINWMAPTQSQACRARQTGDEIVANSGIAFGFHDNPGNEARICPTVVPVNRQIDGITSSANSAALRKLAEGASG